MQHVYLWPDHSSVIRNREVSLIRRSSKHMFLWPIIYVGPLMHALGICIREGSLGRNREVPSQLIITAIGFLIISFTALVWLLTIEMGAVNRLLSHVQVCTLLSPLIPLDPSLVFHGPLAVT